MELRFLGQDFSVQMMDQDLLQTDVELERVLYQLNGSFRDCRRLTDTGVQDKIFEIIDGENAGKRSSGSIETWFRNVLFGAFTVRGSAPDRGDVRYVTQEKFYNMNEMGCTREDGTSSYGRCSGTVSMRLLTVSISTGESNCTN